MAKCLSSFVFALLGVTMLGGCAVVPGVPSDTDYPVDEIMRYAACELQTSYRKLDREYPGAKAREYAVTVQLQPKADLEFNARAGLIDKSSLVAQTFVSGALGAAPGAGAPGAGVDTTGHQDGSVYFIAKSSDLINDKSKPPLECTHWSPSKHALARNLDIRSWLIRSSDPTRGLVGPFKIDKHSFLAEITIQWDAGGLFTYNFPMGSAFATGSGRYKLDEALTITTVHEDPKVVLSRVAMLPTGKYGIKTTTIEPTTSTISPETRQRLDLLQLQQSIQNLQVTIPH